MGAAASLPQDKYVLSLEDAKALAGEQFNQEKWDAISNENGTITKQQWEELAGFAAAAPAAPDASPGATPDAAPDAIAASAPDTAPGASHDAAPEATPDVAPGATPDAAPGAAANDEAKTDINTDVVAASADQSNSPTEALGFAEAGPSIETMQGEQFTLLTQCLRKVGANVKLLREQLGDRWSDDMPVCVLVQTGVYNPCSLFHIRNFHIAKAYIENKFRWPVVGGLLSPTHETNARSKFKQHQKTMIPARHRLALCQLAVRESSWLAVNQWEATRRAHLDYLSVLEHTQKICKQQFPRMKFQIVYLAGEYNLVRASPKDLREMGCRVMTVARTHSMEKMRKQMGERWSGVASLIEDISVLDHQIEQMTSQKLRTALIKGKLDKNALVVFLGKSGADYIQKHKLDKKMSGQGGAKWESKDLQWRKQEKEFIAATTKDEEDVDLGVTQALADYKS